MHRDPETRIITQLIMKILPAQILMAAIGAVNGIISGLFASNFVGPEAMSAIQLYSPVYSIIYAITLMFLSGAQILCRQYLGRNQFETTRRYFSLDLLIAFIFSAGVTLILLILAVTGSTGRFADPEVGPLFNRYVLGQAIGVIPLVLGQQLAVFLTIERRSGRALAGTVVYIIINIILNYYFVAVRGMEAFGLALASSIGLWAFFLVQLQYYFTDKAVLRFSFKGLRLRETIDIMKIGLPGSLSQGYQTLRRIIVNGLILTYAGSEGLSAFGASDTLLGIFWAVPAAMLAVSRLLMSISIGEEDRKTLAIVMRNAIYRFIPAMCVISAFIMVMAVPFTKLYYRDPSSPVYSMTVWGFRILPLCMPLSIICTHFTCYGQQSGKQVLVHLLSVLDGFVFVSLFSMILMPFMKMNGVYAANVINGAALGLVVAAYSWIVRKKFPHSIEDLMVIPDSFGVPDSERLDISLNSMDEVVSISENIIDFCKERGIDDKRAYYAGLALEEAAGNVIEHGFSLDGKKHTVDVRVVHKDGDLILRIKDDCPRFDPLEQQNIFDHEDPARNVGLRTVRGIARDITYQNLLGLNVLTIVI